MKTVENSLLILVFCTLLLFHRGYSQNALVIGDTLSLFPGCIVVTPQGLATIKYQQSEYDKNKFNSKYNFNFEKWLKSFNEFNKSNYEYLNNSINPTKVVLATTIVKSKPITIPKYDTIISEFSFIRDNNLDLIKPYLKRTSREYLFLNDRSYKYKVLANVNFSKSKLLNYDFAFSRTDLKGKLINGLVALRFYNNDSSNFEATYTGYMKNGLPDGYGMLVQRCNACDYGFTQSGFWKDGIFMHEESINDIVKTLSKTIFSIENNINPSPFIEEALFNLDPLLPSQTNGCTIIVNFSWNERDKNKSLKVAFTTKDCLSLPEIYILEVNGSDNLNYIKMKKAEAQSQSFKEALNFGLSLFKKKIENETVNYDTYLRYWIGMSSNIERDLNQDGYEKYRQNIYIDIRMKKSEPWRNIASFGIDCFISNTSENNYIMPLFPYLSKLDYTFQKGVYKNENQLLSEVISFIKKKYPSPINDDSQENMYDERNNVSDFLDRRMVIYDRLKNSHLYDFIPSDTIHGIWKDEDNLLIINSANRLAYIFTNKYFALGASYNDMVVEKFFYEIKNNAIELYHFGDYGQKMWLEKKYEFVKISKNKIELLSSKSLVRLE